MTTITALPPAPSRDDANTFASKADTFLSALPTFGTQCNAVASEVNAAAAQASAAASLISQDGYTGSSTSTNTINSSGSPSFTTQTGRLWTAGQLVQLTATGSPTNYMVGTVSSYSGSTLTVALQNSNGSGTFSDWKIGLVSNYIQPVDMLVNGLRVGKGASSGSFNTAFGVSAIASGTGGGYNVAIGASALASSSFAYNNVAIGYEAMASGNSASSVVAIGYQAFKSPTANISGVAVGAGALSSITNGGYNVAVGTSALTSCTGGSNHTAIGTSSMPYTTGGNSNVAVGYGALWYNTTGSNSVAIGANALQSNTTYSRNTAIGQEALYYANTSDNIGIGYQAVKGAASGITGASNIGIGNWSLQALTTGYGNISIGVTTSGGVSTAANVTVIGNSAFPTGNYSNITSLGANSSVTGAYQVQLGGSGTTAYAYGAVQDRSDSRDKTDIRDTVLGLDFIKAIRPVDYRLDMREDYKPERPADLPEYANDDEKAAHALALEAWQTACKWENLHHDGTHKRNRYHHGVIAQEVQALIEQTGVDFGGFQDHKISGGEDVLSIGYSEFIAPLIKAVQELAAQNAELSARIATLEAK